MLLIDLKPGQSAVVTDCLDQSLMRRRFQDLGLVKGTNVQCIGKSPLGDPSAYLIRRTVIALRKEDAGSILIRRVTHE